MNQYYVLAMSHVDLGFVNPEDELTEYLEILLTRVLDVMDRDDRVIFGIEQMAHYRTLQNRRPDLFNRVKAYVKTGRIEVLGAMASTMETNLPAGECFVRNLRIGRAFAQAHLGEAGADGWLIDTFGMHAQLPQVFSQLGVKRVWASRFGGALNENLFRAVGLDGSEVTVFGWDSGSYNVPRDILAERLCRGFRDVDALFADADALDGTGPRAVFYYLENEEHFSTRYLENMDARAGRADQAWQTASFREYLCALCAARVDIPAVHADLNPEFTATFSLRAPLKTENRRAEGALLEAETWSALLGVRCDLEESWWDIAHCQFHDILTGSHGDDTYHSVMARYGRIIDAASAQTARALTPLLGAGDRLLIANGLPFPVSGWVELPPEYRAWGVPLGGNAYLRAELPPAGYAPIDRQPAAPARHEQRHYIENEHMRLSLCPNVGLKELSLADGTRVMLDAEDFLIAQQDNGGFQIEEPTGCELYPPRGRYVISQVTVSDAGQEITLSGAFPPFPWDKGSALGFSVRFTLLGSEPALSVRVSLDWMGEGARVRLKLPNLVKSAQGIYEIPFGAVARGAYDGRRTARGEWPAHRFVAVEDGEIGLALINRGIAGVQTVGSTLITTLLRAYKPGRMAWVPPTALTSRHGESNYEFLLAPYRGRIWESDVYRLAQRFNNPPRVVGISGAEEASFLSLEPRNLVLSAAKAADDGSGDMILRYYETAGRDTQAKVQVTGALSAVRSDLTEVEGGELACVDGHITLPCAPFEIQTLRVKRGGQP